MLTWAVVTRVQSIGIKYSFSQHIPQLIGGFAVLTVYVQVMVVMRTATLQCSFDVLQRGAYQQGTGQGSSGIQGTAAGKKFRITDHFSRQKVTIGAFSVVSYQVL